MYGLLWDHQLFQVRLDRRDPLVPGCLLSTCHSEDPVGSSLLCRILSSFRRVSNFLNIKPQVSTQQKLKNLKKRKLKKQVLIQPLFNQQQHSDEFSSKVYRAFLSANIPLYKVEHAEVRALFKDFAGRELPHESTLRKNYVSSEYEKVLHAIRDDIGSHPIWLSIDETTDCCRRYMANVIVGKLSPSEPGKGHLILCSELDVTNHGTIVRTAQAALRLLWPTFSDEEVNKSTRIGD
ncbi:uncharacterized protein [Anabrus simplex]|uniref:uncharacterized protein n=1 Tax=Anabrus simplex TaxID=316456 RepID=UPI0035A34290